jgi:hypothetical protein
MAATRFAVSIPAAAIAPISIGVIAVCLSIVGHEAIGHGGACLAAGGRVTLLNIVDFHCGIARPWIDLAGSVGNLVLVLVGLTLARPAAPSGARLLGLALFAFNAFWIAGYLIYAGVLNTGDWVYPAEVFVPGLPWRPVAIIVGVGLYALTMNRIAVLTPPAAARPLRTAYLAAAVAIVLAGALYAPARGHVVQTAAIEIGLASLGLWFAVRRARGVGDWMPPTSPVWAIVAGLLWLVIAAVLGPGLPR